MSEPRLLTDAQAIAVGIERAIYVGATGETGATGATPALTIGTVSDGSTAAATLGGTPERPVLNLVLPIGKTGGTGATGLTGPQGAKGDTGNGIASWARTSGNGATGTTDIYTLAMSDGTQYTYSVYNGRNGIDGIGSGDMSKSTYDANNDGIVDRADVADELASTSVIAQGQVEGLPAALTGKASLASLNAHTGNVSNPHGVTVAQIGAAATTHTHTTAQVTGLDTALAAKAVKTTQTTATVLTSAWTGTAAPYTATVTVAGLVVGAKAEAGLASTATAAQREAARNAILTPLDVTTAGKLSLIADGDKPGVDLPIVITVWG